MTTANTLATLGNGPAFSAYQSSAQALTGSTFTKVQLQTEEFDTNNCFDSTTNYRFTPTVSGYYQITGAAAGNSTTNALVSIYKNGSEFKRGNYITASVASTNVTAVVYFNGSTDYVELYAFFGSSQNLVNLSTHTYFQAALVRGA
jgi:hypothetical protein